MTPLLRLEAVSKRFALPGASVLALDAVSLEVRRGETLAIVGESGSGKSTLANIVLGAQLATSGTLHLDGTTLGPRRPRELRRRMALVQQNPYSALNPRQSIRRSIELPLIVHGISSRRQRARRVAALLAQVGLSPELAARRPLGLSGGQRQRVAIARALASEPELVVLDEPTASLDVSVQAHILRLLEELQRALGLTYVFITHDLAVVRAIASRVVVMYQGRVVEEGPVGEIFAAPRHRYTNLLLASIPTVAPEDDALRPAWPWDAAPADSTPGTDGCAFRPRCPFAIPRCSTERPELVAAGQGHSHACFVPAPAGAPALSEV
jgi:oligopeptide/dipeptide ABC transporter ATP-binding protein